MKCVRCVYPIFSQGLFTDSFILKAAHTGSLKWSQAGSRDRFVENLSRPYVHALVYDFF